MKKKAVYLSCTSTRNRIEDGIVHRDLQLFIGRSMIEMLGVLAIIGVLSIGGLIFYKKVILEHHFNLLKEMTQQVYFASHELCYQTQVCSLNVTTSQEKERRDLLCDLFLSQEFCNRSYSENTTKIDSINVVWRFGVSNNDSVLAFLVPSAEMCRKIVDFNWPRLIQMKVQNSEYKYTDGRYITSPTKTYKLSDSDKDYLKGFCSDEVTVSIQWNDF